MLPMVRRVGLLRSLVSAYCVGGGSASGEDFKFVGAGVTMLDLSASDGVGGAIWRLRGGGEWRRAC